MEEWAKVVNCSWVLWGFIWASLEVCPWFARKKHSTTLDLAHAYQETWRVAAIAFSPAGLCSRTVVTAGDNRYIDTVN